jgi:hypothetical protein
MNHKKFRQVIDYKQSLFNQLEQMSWGVETYLMNLDKFKHIDPVMLLAKMNAIITRHRPHTKVKDCIIKIEPIKSNKGNR